jgi:hypothetical protein
MYCVFVRRFTGWTRSFGLGILGGADECVVPAKNLAIAYKFVNNDSTATIRQRLVNALS